MIPQEHVHGVASSSIPATVGKVSARHIRACNRMNSVPASGGGDAMRNNWPEIVGEYHLHWHFAT